MVSAALLLRAIEPLLPSPFPKNALLHTRTAVKYHVLPTRDNKEVDSSEAERPHPLRHPYFNNNNSNSSVSLHSRRRWLKALAILVLLAIVTASLVFTGWMFSSLRAELIAVSYVKCGLPPWWLFTRRPQSLEQYKPSELTYQPERAGGDNNNNRTNSSRVGMIQTCSVPVKRWSLELLVENHRAYVEKWGIPWQVRVDIPGGSWSKIQAAREWMERELERPEGQKLEWLFFTDMDTMVVNPEVPLDALIPPPGTAENAILVMAKDTLGWNGGNWFIRVSPLSLLFLSEVSSYQHHVPRLWFEEQSAIQLLDTKHSMSLKGEILEMPARFINSYAGSKRYIDSKDTFSLHWPSLHFKRTDLLPFLRKLEKGEVKRDESTVEKNREMVLSGLREFWATVTR